MNWLKQCAVTGGALLVSVMTVANSGGQELTTTNPSSQAESRNRQSSILVAQRRAETTAYTLPKRRASATLIDRPPATNVQFRGEDQQASTVTTVAAESLIFDDAPISSVSTLHAQEQVPVPDGPGVVAPVQPDMAYENGGYAGDPYQNGSLWGDLWGSCQGWCQAGLVFGIEGSILFPVGEPSQKVILQDQLTNRQFEGASQPGIGAGIRTWVGVEKYGWGFRVGYWHFGNNWIDPRPVVPVNAPPTFLESYFLTANVLDIELTQQLCLGLWKLDTSFGGRYASLSRNATVVGYGTVGGADVFGLAMGANEIEGSGFTFSIGERKPLFCGLNAFCRFRGSLLWADSTTSVLTESNVISRKDPSGAANSQDKAYAAKDHKENVFIAEVQVGLQFEEALGCIPAIFFLRGGFEYQHWKTGDLLASSNSFAYLQGAPTPVGSRVDAFANAHDGDLDLIGFFIGTGLTY